MQTQGISLITSEMSGMISTKSTKASDATFQSFMNERASKVDGKSAEKVAETTVSSETDRFEDKSSVSKTQESRPEVKDSAKQDVTDSSKATEKMEPVEKIVEEELDVSTMNRQMMEMLQQVFGLSEEEIQDILGQMGIGLQDLMFQLQNGKISAVAVETLQNLVMEVHGITDKAAFLTNADLNQELNQLVEQTAQIVADALGVSVEELGQAEQSLMFSFSEQMEQTLKNAGREKNANEMADVSDGMQNNANEQGASDGIRVVVEAEGNGAGADSQSDSLLDTTKTVSMANDNQADMQTAANLFAEKLEQAFDEKGLQAEATGKTMTQIVEQVVNQVKIRVMPETTSMELQLHPASLGRVNLQVSTTNGVATAVLTVENQVAKEALESQMITLKQTFAEQGLKVDAVEVTVSEFGLEHQNREEAQGQQKQEPGKRRFRSEAGAETGEGAVSENETDVVRRDVNSVVDYTA